jgi:alkylhydroperoxidase family enzyme
MPIILKLILGLVAQDEPDVPRRLLGMIRMQASFLVSCPFCIDLNARGFRERGITDEEIRALRGLVPLELVGTITPAERAALRYAACLSATPPAFPADVIDDVRRHFTPRGVVLVAGTAAQVNFWARLTQSLGVPPAGFTSDRPVLDLDGYRTARQPTPRPSRRGDGRSSVRRRPRRRRS